MLNHFYEKGGVESAWQAFRSRGYPDTSTDSTGSDSFALIAQLPPLLRTLLVTDGTITRSLEAYFWEPVNIEQIALSSGRAQKAIPWLSCEAGEDLLFREVRLVGKTSKTSYATAYSIIVLKCVPDEICEPLRQGGIGIGVLLRRSGLESYRELLDVGYSNNASFAENGKLGALPNRCTTSEARRAKIVFRTYRINVSNKPLMLITEKFPKKLYENH